MTTLETLRKLRDVMRAKATRFKHQADEAGLETETGLISLGVQFGSDEAADLIDAEIKESESASKA